MRGFVIGLVLGVVLLAAVVVVPRFTIPADKQAAATAREKAERARRELYYHDPFMPVLGAMAGIDALRDADFDQLLSDDEAALDKLRETFSEQVSAAKTLDRRSKVKPSDLRPVSADPSGIRGAVAKYAELAAANDKWLRNADKLAREAVSTSGNTFGVPIISGMVAMVEARERFNHAQRLHAQLVDRETDTIAAAQRYAQQKAFRDYYGAIRADEALARLRTDTDELNATLKQTRTQRDRLAETIDQRKAELARLRAQIQQVQDQRLALQQRGFTPGSDSSFESYKQQFQRLSDQLRDLQERETLLSRGGYEEVKLDADDPLAGEIQVDGPIIGLDELERRLATMEDKVRRYEDGVRMIAAQVKTAEMYASSGKDGAATTEQNLAAAKTAYEQARDRMTKLTEQVTEAETEALAAANRAISMFERSRSAASALQRAAREAQQSYDPQRQNERLRKITSDNMPATAADVALAEANTLLGRIYAQQIHGLESLDRTWSIVAKAMADVSYDAEKLQAEIEAAREKAGPALAAASETYAQLADSTNIPWLKISAQASQATVEYLRSQVFGAQGREYRNAAIESITAAADAVGQDPHGAAFVILRDYLSASR